jgi:hypothetical protein
MNVRVEVVCLSADGTEQRREMMAIERTELVMETLGMSLKEGKALLEGVQDVLIAHQVQEYLEQHRKCSNCGKRYTSKDAGTTPVKTLFGQVDVPNPRWNACACQSGDVKTFRPARAWLQGRTTPEMLYLETKWASLIPFAKVTDLLKDVLPVGDSANPQTARNHLHATAERIENELGEERQLNLFEGSEEEWKQQPLPDGPITVGIDGGYVRGARKQGWFEVIAGKSVVSFRREEGAEAPPPLCFGFVQTHDTKPRRRLWELMKSQGLQENQQVVFMSDGRRKRSADARVPSSIQRAPAGLVPHHDAVDCSATTNQGIERRTATDRRRCFEAAGERETLALAREHRGGAGTSGQLGYGSHFDPSAFVNFPNSGSDSGLVQAAQTRPAFKAENNRVNRRFEDSTSQCY